VNDAPMEPAGKKQTSRKRVTVLFSGRGTNMASLIQACMAPEYPAVITQAITNVPDAGGIEIADYHGIPTKVLDHKEYESREAHEEALAAAVSEGKPDIICLAGYMRILTADFVKKYRGKILNIHPSLLPAFKGVDTHHRALVEGVRIHGATVHFVNETLDGGQIISQVAVPVLSGDDDDSLAARVLETEHHLYPHALSLVASGAIRLSGSRVVVDTKLEKNEAVLYSPRLPS